MSHGYFTEDEFLASSRAAVSSTSSESVLDSLGWSELLPYLDEPEARRAIFALFRAQGRELATTPALGLLMAQAYGELGLPDGVSIAIARTSPLRGRSFLILGPVPAQVLVDQPGVGASLIATRPEHIRPIDIAGRLEAAELLVDPEQLPVTIPDRSLDSCRRRALYLGRVATAFDMLGAAEQAVALAVDYAKEREQFGRPIGTYQAVRHNLASAVLDCEAVAGLGQQIVDQGPVLPSKFDVLLKALAGRNGRRACQRSLQTLGAVGFTTEHSHHHYYGRVLGLDSLLGTSAEMTDVLAFDAMRDPDQIQNLSLAAIHRAS